MMGTTRKHCPTYPHKVTSLEPPEVDLVAKDNSLKLNPSEKVVIYGFVTERTSSSDLQWTQVCQRRMAYAESDIIQP